MTDSAIDRRPGRSSQITISWIKAASEVNVESRVVTLPTFFPTGFFGGLMRTYLEDTHALAKFSILKDFLYIFLIFLWYFQILLLSHLRGCVRFEIVHWYRRYGIGLGRDCTDHIATWLPIITNSPLYQPHLGNAGLYLQCLEIQVVAMRWWLEMCA